MRVKNLNILIDQRVVAETNYILSTKGTIRGTAKFCGCSKSTVHQDLTTRLKDIDFDQYLQVQDLLEINKAEGYLRGGQSTKEKSLIKKIR